MKARHMYMKLGDLICQVDWAHISPDNTQGSAIVSDLSGHRFALDVDVIDVEQWQQYIDA
jgi:hypothetical protein